MNILTQHVFIQICTTLRCVCTLMTYGSTYTTSAVNVNMAGVPDYYERKGSLNLRSDHMNYGRATLNSNW